MKAIAIWDKLLCVEKVVEESTQNMIFGKLFRFWTQQLTPTEIANVANVGTCGTKRIHGMNKTTNHKS